jgi:hypothetical protein
MGLTQSSTQWAPGALSSGVKQPGQEDDHWLHWLAHVYSQHSAQSIKYRDKFTIFTFFYNYIARKADNLTAICEPIV